jgi:hypothetical protein
VKKQEKSLCIILSALLVAAVLQAVWAFTSPAAKVYEFHNRTNEELAIEISGKDQPVNVISGDFRLKSWGTGAHQALINQECFHVMINTDMKALMLVQDFDGQAGVWFTDLESIETGRWISFVIAYDKSSLENDPLIMVNGKEVNVNELLTPIGKACSDAGKVTYLGCQNALYPTIDGNVRGVRITHEQKTQAGYFWMRLFWWVK